MAMTADQRERLLDIRKHGKTGEVVSAEEAVFCAEMHTRFPAEYREVEAELLAWLRTTPWYEVL